jgi:hypothetical protein
MTRILAHLFLSIVVAGYVFAEPEDPRDIVETADHITHYSRSAYETGRRDAERDLLEGRLIFEIYGGPPPPGEGEWKKLLAQKYHIEIKEVAGCTVNYQIVGHARGYNEVSGAEIDRRFGANLIRNTRDEVLKKWDEDHKK